MENTIQHIKEKKDGQRPAQKRTSNKMKASQSSGDFKKSLKLQTSVSRSGRQSQTASPTTSIPSSYLRMLDIRIAELENVTGFSFPSSQSPVQASPINLISLKSKAAKLATVPTYLEKSSSRLSVSSQDEPTSLAIQRYLDDSTEADGVYVYTPLDRVRSKERLLTTTGNRCAAILASNDVNSR